MWNDRPIRQGLLIVISGPSGSGKTSVARALCQADASLAYSVSATTRPPRPNETDGVDYDFLPRSEFEDLIQRGGFLEWTKYGDYYYGTLKSTIESTIASGKDLLLEIDVKGAMQVKALSLKCIYIFILPLSFATLKTRLRSRNTESDSELQRRLLTAESEIACVKDYDYCVVNPDNGVEQAVEQIRHIITAERCRIDCSLLDWISQEFSIE
ncbi:MAG: guanylate kinase [Candidatus Poribacteria bacterium]|nr:guanylate kinase [Candidatus Poribacteria bacterium]